MTSPLPNLDPSPPVSDPGIVLSGAGTTSARYLPVEPQARPPTNRPPVLAPGCDYISRSVPGSNTTRFLAHQTHLVSPLANLDHCSSRMSLPTLRRTSDSTLLALENLATEPPPTDPARLGREYTRSRSSPLVSTLSAMAAVYTQSPLHAVVGATSPGPTHTEHQLVAGLTALHTDDGSHEGGCVPSNWTACLGAPSGSDEFENYALHGSPMASNQSSPRSWGSPEQLGPTPWEAATEQIHSRYHGLDPQLSGYLHGGSIPTSFPADAVTFLPSQNFAGPDDGCQLVRSQTEPYPVGYHTSPRDGYTSSPESEHPLSPCSTNLTLPMEDALPGSPGDEVNLQVQTLLGLADDPGLKGKVTVSGARLLEAPGKEEPYASLIHRAFLSTPRRAMTLQEIYQWFRENTNKGKDESKGWQNSIRHNLSMNQVGFQPRSLPFL